MSELTRRIAKLVQLGNLRMAKELADSVFFNKEEALRAVVAHYEKFGAVSPAFWPEMRTQRCLREAIQELYGLFEGVEKYSITQRDGRPFTVHTHKGIDHARKYVRSVLLDER